MSRQLSAWNVILDSKTIFNCRSICHVQQRDSTWPAYLKDTFYVILKDSVSEVMRLSFSWPIHTEITRK